MSDEWINDCERTRAGGISKRWTLQTRVPLGTGSRIRQALLHRTPPPPFLLVRLPLKSVPYGIAHDQDGCAGQRCQLRRVITFRTWQLSVSVYLFLMEEILWACIPENANMHKPNFN